MGLTRRRFLRIGGGVAGTVIVVPLWGCADDDDAAPATTGAESTAGTVATSSPTAGTVGETSPDGTAVPTTSAASDEPTPGGALTIAAGNFVGNDFFPGNSLGAQGFSYVQMAWPLFLFETASFDVVEGVAGDYEASPDGLQHTMSIRDGYRFHDGSPIDVAAVVANLRASLYEDDPLRGPGPYAFIATSFGGFPGIVTAVDAADETTLSITLSEPRPDLRSTLTQFYIFNPAVMAEAPQGWGTDLAALGRAGSGPFRLTQFSPGEFAEYERFPEFPEPALLDALRIQRVAEPAARGLAVRSGDVEVAVDLGRPDFEQLGADPAYAPVISNPGINRFLVFNAERNPLLQDRNVRQGLVSALDREAYVEAFFPTDLAELGTQIILVPGTEGYDDDAQALPYDVDAARTLLEDAGAAGTTLELLAQSSDDPALYEAVQADLAEVGVNVNLNLVDPASFFSEFPNSDLVSLGFGNTGQDLNVIRLLFVGALDSFGPPKTPEIDAAVAAASAATDIETQTASLQEVMRLSVEDVSGAPVAYVAQSAIVRANVRDFALSASPQDPQHRTWLSE